MKKHLWVTACSLSIIVVIICLFLVPNPLRVKMMEQAKLQGYIAYTPEEATAIAYDRCTTCHGVEKILQYCSRCGPPFIVVAHAMKKYVELANLESEKVKPFSDAELSAIIQAWNALVGNWEDNWRPQDIRKMLQNDQALIDLADSPLEDRYIELALKDKTAPGSYKEVQSFGGLVQ